MKRIMVLLIAPVLLLSVLWTLWRYYSYSGPIPDPPCPQGSPVHIGNLHERAAGIINRYRAAGASSDERDLRGTFSVTGHGPADLYGSADMAYILWILGELEERTTPHGRAQWAAFINSFQNPETGLFDRGGATEESSVHATAFAVAALRLLGHKPRYPLRWTKTLFNSPSSVGGWLDSLGWNEIWTGSHEAGAAAAALDAPDDLNLPEQWKGWLLSALTERADPATGFWKRGIADRFIGRATTVDLGGAAHFWWLYRRIGRPIPYPEKAFCGILALQHESGIWGNRLFNGPLPQGIDLDAINGLRIAWGDASPSFRDRHRRQLLLALERYACAARYHLAPHDSFLRLYSKSHKLVGTLNALAELDLFYRELTGRSIVVTERPLRSALEVVTWQ
ncbi:MAG: hypothetical protein JXA20_17440 [Spirochaetes bacterium]|nr:hypothetical protein [Spirochaetota bacterium]